MKKKILLIEDNVFNREIAEVALKKAGYEVVAACDGAEAIKKIACGPDLVLLDLSLPKINGWEVIRKIRENVRYVKLPVIALTAHAMVGDKERALESGCSSYLSKPCLPADIVKEVKKFLDPEEPE